MFDHRHYIPILKAKGGELLALRDLSPQAKAMLTPLLEMQPPSWDFEDDKPSKTVKSQLDTAISKIGRAWTGNGPAFVDTRLLEESEVEGGDNPLCYVLHQLEPVGVECIPVVYLSSGAKHTECARRHVENVDRGCCLRLTLEDINADSLEEDIESLRESLGIEREHIDLILDLEAFSPSESARVLIAAKACLQSVPSLTAWRTLTLAGTSFPVNMSEFSASSANSIPRTELAVWDMLVRSPKTPRLPAFGDYAIQHPDLVELDPRIITMSASVRYATDADWLLLRGRSVRKHGFKQYEDLCKKLAGRSEFLGGDHCWGCDYIQKCGSGTESHGNAMTWRRVGTVHHVTLVADQISNYPAP